jgi:hypothetical protein
MGKAALYTPPGYSQLDVPGLFNAATVANFPLTSTPPIWPWSPIKLIQGLGGFGTQGFTAYGSLLCDPNNTVGLVVLGLQWPSLLDNYQNSFHTLSVLPTGPLPPPPATPIQPPPQCDWGLGYFYSLIQPTIWSAVQYMKTVVQEFQNGIPIITVGYGPAAALAQLAAVDLLPGQTYNGSASPAISMSSYAFSCPAFGNASFVQGFASAIPNGFVINLETSAGLPVDLFPEVAASTGMFVAGSPQGPTATVPVPTCPWLEREPCFYGAALNGTTCSASSTEVRKQVAAEVARPLVVEANTPWEPTPKPAAAAGYSAATAYSLSQLCSIVYQQFEHPTVTPVPPSPYSSAQTLSVNGSIWATIFNSPQTLTVVFRGPVTWEETVNLWGGSFTASPAWLPNPGQAQPLASCQNLYATLGPAMRQALASYGSGNTVYLAGHGGGGVLANMALWDLQATPISGLTLGGVYTFGAAPVGNLAFAAGFAAACGSMSYQLARPLDVIPQLQLGAPFAIVPITPQTPVTGGDTDSRNGFTYHSIVVYQSLLNVATVSAPAEVADQTVYQGHLKAAGVPWNEVTKCAVDTSQNNGKVVLSWDLSKSYVTPTKYLADGTAVVALQDVLVQPGDELSVESPHGQKVLVVARSLQLGAGAVLRVSTDATLHLGELRAVPAAPDAALQATPAIVSQGCAGPAGTNGYNGGTGPAGGPGGNGGPGNSGSNGAGGGYGANGANLIMNIGTLSGTFLVVISGGAGGNGGVGGNGGMGGAGGPAWQGHVGAGGAGGNGGMGGKGGNAGNGATVVVYYQTMESGTSVQLQNISAFGGAGGMGGAGGSGGSGNPIGPGGITGPLGQPGTRGATGQLTIIQVQGS